MRLSDQVREETEAGNLLPTPRATRGGSATETVELLPTPAHYDGSRGGSQHPAKRGAGGHQPSVADVVEHLLPTPRASDGEKGGPNQRGSKGDLTISSAVHLLPTPKAGDADFGLPRTSGRPPERSTHLATRLHYTDFGQYAPAIERWETVTGRKAPAPTELTDKGKHRLSAAFVEWMMGLPDGWVTAVPLDNKAAAKKAPRDRRKAAESALTRVQQLRALGNGVVTQQAVYAITWLLERAEHDLKGLAA